MGAGRGEGGESQGHVKGENCSSSPSGCLCRPSFPTGRALLPFPVLQGPAHEAGRARQGGLGAEPGLRRGHGVMAAGRVPTSLGTAPADAGPKPGPRAARPCTAAPSLPPQGLQGGRVPDPKLAGSLLPSAAPCLPPPLSFQGKLRPHLGPRVSRAAPLLCQALSLLLPPPSC